MFQFPRFPPPSLCVQLGVSRYHPGWVAPFGHPRIIACPRLPEAFRCLATSFFGPRCQGIHRVLFARIRLLFTSSPEPAQHNASHLVLSCTPTHTLLRYMYRRSSLRLGSSPSACLSPDTLSEPETTTRHKPTLHRRCVCLTSSSCAFSALPLLLR
jgi:hypothetical protein